MKDKIKDDDLRFFKNDDECGSYIKNSRPFGFIRVLHRRIITYKSKYSFGYSDHYYMYGTFEGEQINYWKE